MTIIPKYKFDYVIDNLIKIAYNSALVNKHASCIIKSGRTFSYGVNKYYKVKIDNKNVNLGIHAEIDAMSNIHSKYIKGFDILVIRIGKNCTLKNSRPCNSCIDKMKQKGIHKVYYSTSSGDIVYEIVNDMPKLHECSGQRMRNRCV
jgi:cytidine deaminase